MSRMRALITLTNLPTQVGSLFVPVPGNAVLVSPTGCNLGYTFLHLPHSFL